MYSVEPLCAHDGDGARQHIATIYDHEEAREILRLWNSLENATPHDHDHNDMTPLDHALAHNKQLTQQLEEVKLDLEFRRDLYALQTKQLEKVWRDLAAIAKDRDLWKAETKRWRDMYIEYDEMLEGDLEKAKKRITNVISKIKSLEKEMNDEKY